LIGFLIRRFIANYDDVKDTRVREAYGVLSGVLGIVCNLLLFLIKLGTGLVINSIAVLSDAFNNLTDLSSSAIVILGAKLSSRPPDQEHPHGHGRFEYICSLVISLMIMLVGLQLVRGSVAKIIQPQAVKMDLLTALLLLISVGIKLWMFLYNRHIGRLISSSINHATALDSISDAAATAAVFIGVIINQFVSIPIDGILGLLISCMIIYTGFITAKSAVNLLLGTSPDPKIAARIISIIEANTGFSNPHDLKLHDYGPGRISGSIHVVVPHNAHVENIHAEIDRIESEIKSELGIDIVIHADPGLDCSDNMT